MLIFQRFFQTLTFTPSEMMKKLLLEIDKNTKVRSFYWERVCIGEKMREEWDYSNKVE